ncbi:hypothetical protein M0R72_12300 [Candidatus Pacearchaeota archaeon]|nr:hypothetical protein [Candidatus Pacearchaeota archaeon]
MSKTEMVIDPEEQADLLMEITGKKIEPEVTIITLMVKDASGDNMKMKVRYLPANAASNLQFDDGTPIRNEQNPKFKYKKTMSEILKKINGLCLLNIKIIDDLSFPDHEFQKGEVRFSHLAPGEWTRLRDLCFPGANFDTPDGEIEDNAPVRKSGKGVRKDAPPASA